MIHPISDIYFLNNAQSSFLLGLASSNTVYLILIIIRKSISDLFLIEKKYNYPKPIAGPLTHMAYNASIYLTILLAFERYLCVCWPKKAEKICTPKKTKVPSMSFYSDFILILSRFYSDFILTLSRFFRNLHYPNFIQISSWFSKKKKSG